jgi:membrane protein involved in colicin uptake
MATQKKSPAAAKKAPAATKPAARKATPHILVDGKLTKAVPQTGKRGDDRTKISGAQIDWVRTNAKQVGGTWSQPKIAAKLGISQPTVSYILRGKIRNS